VFELADSAVPAEILVISGQIHFKGADYGQGSWLRLPDTAQTEISAGQHGTTVYLKSGDFFNIDIASFHE
jgi:hypothetical protein